MEYSSKPKLIRLTTVPVSMNIILKGQLSFLSNYFEVVGVTGFDSKHYVDIEKRERVRMVAIEMERAISPIKDLVALFKLYRLFRVERPTIVHTQTPKAGLLGMLAAWLVHIPVRLHTVGGLPLTEAKGMKRKLLNVAERLTYACAHKVYPNSHGLAQIILKNRFCKLTKLQVLANGSSNGVDTRHFDSAAVDEETQKSLRMRYGIDDQDFVFLFVGRIAKEKGIEELLSAFVELQYSSPSKPCKLILVGTFEEKYGQLSEFTKERLKSNKLVIMPGRFDDVRPFYSISNAYVFPSYREGFPNTLLEAGSMGLPIIATEINGCNEIVQTNVNGLLIPVKDSVALMNAMRTIMVNDSFRLHMAGNARSSIKCKFKRELVWEALLDQYNFFITKQVVEQ